MQDIIQHKIADEVPLAELFRKINNWFKYLLRKWWIIVIAGMLGGGLGFVIALGKKKEYTAKLTFILEDSRLGGMGSYVGLVSQLGIDLGGASGGNLFQGDNINEFLRSRLIVQKVLLTNVNINSKTQTFADHYLDIYEWRTLWEDKPFLSNIHFDTTKSIAAHTILQDSVLNIIYKTIIQEQLSVGRPDKKLSFIEVKCISLNEYFSKYFAEQLVKEALTFYVETKTRRSKSNVDKLQHQADTILGILNYKTYVAAASQDINVNPTKRLATIQTEMASRDKTLLMTIYGEILKNLGIAKMSLAQETPVIQLIDTPILPLEYKKLSKLKAAIIGAFLFGFFIIVCLSLRQLMQKKA